MVATRKNRRSLAQVVANLSVPKARRVMVKNKEYLVAPLTLIVPGVLNGSDGPLFYPPEQIAASCKDWEGMPLVANHPKKDGRYVSANTDGVLRKAGLGVVRNPRVTDSGKLVAEGWFDVAKCNKVDPRILYNVRNGKPVELSTGLFTQNKAAYGVYNKKAFNAIATDYIPDHVAILMDERGACSLDDGCGVLVNKRLTCNCEGDKMCKACAAKAKKKKKKKGNGRSPKELILNNCGTGGGGFKPGNKCAKGGGGGGPNQSPKTPKTGRKGEAKAESKPLGKASRGTRGYLTGSLIGTFIPPVAGLVGAGIGYMKGGASGALEGAKIGAIGASGLGAAYSAVRSGRKYGTAGAVGSLLGSAVAAGSLYAQYREGVRQGTPFRSSSSEPLFTPKNPVDAMLQARKRGKVSRRQFQDFWNTLSPGAQQEYRTKHEGKTWEVPKLGFTRNSFEGVNMISANNCGTGSGGFKSGNKCAKGGGHRSVGGRVGGFVAGSLLGGAGPLGGAIYGLATRRRKNERRAARGEKPESRTKAALKGAAAGIFGPGGLGLYGAVHNSECLKVGGLLPPNDFL